MLKILLFYVENAVILCWKYCYFMLKILLFYVEYTVVLCSFNCYFLLKILVSGVIHTKYKGWRVQRLHCMACTYAGRTGAKIEIFETM